MWPLGPPRERKPRPVPQRGANALPRPLPEPPRPRPPAPPPQASNRTSPPFRTSTEPLPLPPVYPVNPIDLYQNITTALLGVAQATIILEETQKKYQDVINRPFIGIVDPDSATAGATKNVTLTIDGRDFFQDISVAVMGTQNLPTDYVSETRIKATLDPENYPPGVVALYVRNGELNSNAVNFLFTQTQLLPATAEEPPP
jgi:IPT/TIG domain